MSFGFTVGHREEDGRSDWTMYYENSILVPGRRRPPGWPRRPKKPEPG